MQESLIFLLRCGASNQVDEPARKNSWIIEGTVAFHQNIGEPHARIREISEAMWRVVIGNTDVEAGTRHNESIIWLILARDLF